MMRIPFNRPHVTGKELSNVARAQANGHLSGDGPFTRQCHSVARAARRWRQGAARRIHARLRWRWPQFLPGSRRATKSSCRRTPSSRPPMHSCCVARFPVFVDVRADTLNLDERLIEAAITPRTRAIVPVHYAGVSCAMDVILEIAGRHGLLVIEDAAQGIMSTYRRPAAGRAGAPRRVQLSTKQRTSSPARAARCWSTIRRWPPGPRSFARRGPIAASSSAARWTSTPGSTSDRRSCPVKWSQHTSPLSWRRPTRSRRDVSRCGIGITRRLPTLERAGKVRRPMIAAGCTHNAHMYYLLLPGLEERTAFIEHMKALEIQCVFHYVPLHSSPRGRVVGRASGAMSVTDEVADRLVRLPLWLGLAEHQDRVIDAVLQFFGTRLSGP